ncbi:MAG TPA: thiamine phosphate synthase [Puia sp.]|nr:thiamine phosphate synthase [Puia sp.]
MRKDFLIAVITSPASWDGEADCLEELLQAGVEKLHIRKPGDAGEELLKRLAPAWSSKLVLHGEQEMALAYGVPQIHGHWFDDPISVGLSASTHSWEEVGQIMPGRLEYVFLSPLFDSISKPGYMAGAGLLKRPEGVKPCKLIGLGGIDQHTIGQVMDHGWDGAAVLGYIWEKPEMAVQRFKTLKAIVADHGR